MTIYSTREKKKVFWLEREVEANILLISLPIRCRFEWLSEPFFSAATANASHLHSSFFLAPDETAESHVGQCITYLHVQSSLAFPFSLRSCTLSAFCLI